MCVDNQRRSTRRYDNSLSTVGNDRRSLNSITKCKILKLVDGSFLSATLKVHLRFTVDLLVFTNVFWLDLLQLLVDGLF